MKKRFSLSTVVALMLLVAAVTFILTFLEVRDQLNRGLEDSSFQQSQAAKYNLARKYIGEYFVREVDGEELEDAAIKGMVSSLGDKWSTYLDAAKFKAYKEATDSTYVGIGITASDGGDAVLVMEVYRDSPAFRAGLKPFERIIEVDGFSVADIGFGAAAAAIKGAEGTSVRLIVLSEDGNERKVDVVRAVIPREIVTSEILTEYNIGLVRVADFETGAYAEFREAVTTLQEAKVGGIIFDMRMNPGGKLSELREILDMLLPEGTIFISRDRAGKEERYTSDASEVNLPMVVITNSATYSAAEYFAAVLREYGKALIVGEATTGKGYAQSTIELGDGSALVLSTIEYFTPMGKSLALTGVAPDVEVIMSEDDLRHFRTLTHEQDNQLQAAIETLKGSIIESGGTLPTPTPEPTPEPDDGGDDVEKGGSTMSESLIEDAIKEKLTGDSRKNALDLVEFLHANEMALDSNNDDGEGWAVGGVVGDSAGFMLVNGSEQFPGPWTLWFNSCDFSGPADDGLKETVWAHASPCGKCHAGWEDCGGGDRTIFGKDFQRLCHSPLMFTDPDGRTLESIKKLLLMDK